MIGREQQQIQIKSLIKSTVKNAFITGIRSTGKTFVTKTIFEKVENVAWVKCVECITPRILFNRIISQWAGEADQRKIDNWNEFVEFIKANFNDGQRRFIVMDNCEYLFDGAAPTTFDSILMLADQSKLDICVILVSHLRWTNLISNGPSSDPLVINFPIYSRHEAMEILSLNFPKDYPLEFYKSFIEIIYDAHQHACKDLRELRYLVDHLFPKYIEPIIKEKATMHEASKLFKLFRPILKTSISSLYLREISSLEWNDSLGKSVVKKPNRIELPRLTRYLIIASYLASYNPSKLDVRFFTKGSESRHKISKKAIHNGTKKRQQLLGPRSFGLERMLAIFYSIVHDNVRTFADIHSQIANCISLKLILQISNKNNLDVVSMKSNVSFGLVKELGRSVDFDITQYLFDFIDN